MRYAKRGRLRFTSHRDFSRAFERAIFRARVPMAYSSGFNPHPRISYAGAAPTGAASEAEYVEIMLREVVDPAATMALLDEALPEGLDLVDVVVSEGGSLADRLQASSWRIDIDAPAEQIVSSVAGFLAADEVMVERMTKRGLRTFDARAAVVSLEAVEGGVALVLRHQELAVRADDVIKGLRAHGLEPVTVPLLTRLSQGPFDEATGTIGDPLR
jgi:radical SAM-linked protein